jgi:hypothetical protein
MAFCHVSRTEQPHHRPFLKQWAQTALQSISCGVTYSYEVNGHTHLADGLMCGFSAMDAQYEEGSCHPSEAKRRSQSLFETTNGRSRLMAPSHQHLVNVLGSVSLNCKSETINASFNGYGSSVTST